MKFDVIFPTTEIGNDPIVIRDWAQCAEELGYEHILFYDHVLGASHANREPRFMGPYTENDPFHEVFVTMGYLAGVTTKIEFCTGILILPQRQTALVAKQAAEVAVLSGGRHPRYHPFQRQAHPPAAHGRPVQQSRCRHLRLPQW